MINVFHHLKKKLKVQEKIQACLECGYFSKGVGLFEIQLFSTFILYTNKFCSESLFYLERIRLHTLAYSS